jgi:uncharacterized membrane protein YjgN (DUF898 family)
MAIDSSFSAPRATEGPNAHRFNFHGSGGSLFGIQIVNLFLTLVTLGIYSFWGRVKVRKYIMSQSDFEGDRFAYHGTGKELLIGWLKAVVIIGVPIVALMLLSAGALVYVVFAVFMPVAVVNARRYRLSRTSWRGIRFSFRGEVMDFFKISIMGWLLTAVTLGIAYPIWQNWRQEFLVSHAYFGNRRFDYDGNGKDLLWSYVLNILLSLPTFGICWVWYWARVQRYYSEHTRIGGGNFRSTVTGGGLFGLMFGNLILLIITLGLAWSWVLVRNARFFLGHLYLDGPLETTEIMQEAQAANATGDALSGFFDLDFDLG